MLHMVLHYGLLMSLLLGAVAGGIHASCISHRAIERIVTLLFVIALVAHSGITASSIAASARTLLAGIGLT
jgi:hypothetical protein